MVYFVKAKWPMQVIEDLERHPVKKARFELLPAAYEFIAQALADGAASVVIRPEAE